MADKNDAALRQHLVNLLTLGEAHATYDDAVKGLPEELQGKVPKGAEHSPWQLLEHLRIHGLRAVSLPAALDWQPDA